MTCYNFLREVEHADGSVTRDAGAHRPTATQQDEAGNRQRLCAKSEVTWQSICLVNLSAPILW